MRKILLVSALLISVSNYVYAALPGLCAMPNCGHIYTLTAGCNSICGPNGSGCPNEYSSSSIGITAINTYTAGFGRCPITSGGTIDCWCDLASTTYRCSAGYYGTAISATSGCRACPSNATCVGGNSSTFVCKAGYYKAGTQCISCAIGTNEPTATSAAGATSVSACYIPSDTNKSDNSGNFTYIDDCYYSM